MVFGLGASFVFAKDPSNVSAKGINLHQWDRTELKAHILADTGVLVPGGQGLIFATKFQMFSFGPGGTNDVEVIIEAPESFLDHENRKAWSEGNLKAFNASTNYIIEGKGFIVQRTKGGSTLEISNNVHTTIRRESATGQLLPPVHIFSDYFHFVSVEVDGPDKRVANYKQNVRVEDPEMQLTSGTLRVIIPSGTNEVRDIVAREDVRIRSKVDGSVATGQYAYYWSDQTNELIKLSGSPVWKDTKNEGRAEQFIFDRKKNIVYALTNAEMKLPRNAMASPGLIPTDSNKKPAVVTTNEFVNIAAEYFEIALPTTNRPARSLLARTNVVIVSPADKTRATADTATFDDATGVLLLTRNAVWQTGDTIGKGDAITIHQTNRTFRAEGNASLRLPVNSATNQFMEIRSANYLLRTNVAIFKGGVTAAFQDGKAPSSLTCDDLEVLIRSNEVETIIAKGNVAMTQSLSPGASRTLLCEDMTIQRSILTGTIQSLFAQREVSLIEKLTNSSKKLTAELVTMNFGKTNQLESLLAQQQVRVEQASSWATGQRAVYVAKEGAELFEITGNPLARNSEVDSKGKTNSYIIREAEILRWEPSSSQFSARGPFEIQPD